MNGTISLRPRWTGNHEPFARDRSRATALRRRCGMLDPGAWRVTATSRTPAGSERLREQGLNALIFDGAAAPGELPRLPADITHVLSSVPPAADGDPALARLGDQLAGLGQLEWIGYFSTVGVYGDHAGGWVDETTPPNPMSERGQRRVRAESEWREFTAKRQVAFTVFRLPGIYGAGPQRLRTPARRHGTAHHQAGPGIQPHSRRRHRRRRHGRHREAGRCLARQRLR